MRLLWVSLASQKLPQGLMDEPSFIISWLTSLIKWYRVISDFPSSFLKSGWSRLIKIMLPSVKLSFSVSPRCVKLTRNSLPSIFTFFTILFLSRSNVFILERTFGFIRFNASRRPSCLVFCLAVVSAVLTTPDWILSLSWYFIFCLAKSGRLSRMTISLLFLSASRMVTSASERTCSAFLSW